jgi:anti-anti-sigma factor
MEPAVDPSGSAHIELSGDIDISTINEIRTAVEAAFTRGATSFAFDLKDVTFLDSSALSLFAQTALRAQDVTLNNPSQIVLRVIEVTGLTEILRVT